MDRIVWQDGIYSKGKKLEKESKTIISGAFFWLLITLIFRSLTHIDFLFCLSLWQSISHLKVSAYCPYFLLLLFQPILGRSSIRSSFSLSGQVGRCYWDKRRSLGPFYPTGHFRPIFLVIRSSFAPRRAKNTPVLTAMLCISFHPHLFLICPPLHPLSLFSHPQILKRWISCLGTDAPPASWLHTQAASPWWVCVCVYE